MKKEILEKLDMIDELYPKKRVEESKQRITDIWNCRLPKDRYPFVISPMLYSAYGDIQTPSERVMITLEDLISRAVFTDDTIPSVFPGCLQTTLPNMFGANVIGEGSNSVCEKIIKKYSDVDNLKLQMGKDSIAYKWIEYEKEVLDLTDGRISVHICDMQGPFDAAAQLCGYDQLMLMAYEDEERYARLMDLMSEAFCMCWNGQKEVLGDNGIMTHLFAWDYMPFKDCAAMSIDSLVMLSPAFLEEFVLPYMRKISSRLGKLVVHSCGNFGHNIPVLMKEDYLIGINASQMTTEQMLDCGLTKNKIVIVGSNAENTEKSLLYCKRNNVYASLSTGEFFPLDETGQRAKHSKDWSAKERKSALSVNRRLLDAAAL